MVSNKSKGFIHEDKAISFLEDQGFEILNRNYMGSFGEIDIVCRKDKLFVFVEVKYRRNKEYGFGEESIDYKKMKKIYYTAMEYTRKIKIKDYSIRFDAIIFLGEKVHWIKNILWGDEIGF